MEIVQLSFDMFNAKYVLNKRRRFLLNCLLEELRILENNCFAYQVLIIGSYITDKPKPGDIDVYIRAFTRPSHADFLPKQRKKRVPFLPFNDYDNFTDILPIEPIVTNHPEYYSSEQMLEIINSSNNFNIKKAVLIQEFQRMPMITNLTTIDSQGDVYEFNVTEFQFEYGDFVGMKYELTKEGVQDWKHFDFTILNISDDRVLIYMINNNDHQEFSGKGIVKSMVKVLSEKLNKDIVSSTNVDSLKIDHTEGRIPSVTAYWTKWVAEMDNVNYLGNEDRFIFKRH